MLHLIGAQVGPWSDDALCQRLGIDPNDFFDDVSQAAKDACAACPVRLDCLEHALANGEKGYWGGTSERERWKIRRYRARNGSN